MHACIYVACADPVWVACRCVAYLSTQGADFEGGTFAFSDAPAAAAETPTNFIGLPTQSNSKYGPTRTDSPLSPQKGAAVIFSSGWENYHEVGELVSGSRFAIPSFFTTCPVPPELAATPDDAQGVADELWRTLLSPEATGDFRTFMAKWHGLLAPGR